MFVSEKIVAYLRTHKYATVREMAKDMKVDQTHVRRWAYRMFMEGRLNRKQDDSYMSGSTAYLYYLPDEQPDIIHGHVVENDSSEKVVTAKAGTIRLRLAPHVKLYIEYLEE